MLENKGPKMSSLNEMFNLIYQHAYTQGRKDLLEGLHISPHLAFENYMNENNELKDYIPIELTSLTQGTHEHSLDKYLKTNS
jgi:hypothetical protein